MFIYFFNSFLRSHSGIVIRKFTDSDAQKLSLYGFWASGFAFSRIAMPKSCPYMDFGHRDLRFRRFRCPEVILIWISGIGICDFADCDAQKLHLYGFQASGLRIHQFPMPRSCLSPYFVQSPASEGIMKPPLGERPTVPTAGPSGRQERLNCWVRKRFKNVPRHFSIKASS